MRYVVELLGSLDAREVRKRGFEAAKTQPNFDLMDDDQKHAIEAVLVSFDQVAALVERGHLSRADFATLTGPMVTPD
jgi:hypothetical protein